MGTDAISSPRQRMIDVSARHLSTPTQKSHIRDCKRFAAFLKRSPETAIVDDIRQFQLHLAESGVTICHRNRTMMGLKFLFRVSLRLLDVINSITLALLAVVILVVFVVDPPGGRWFKIAHSRC